MFSYNPAQINDGGLNQMRFELGDCDVAEPEKSAYLCDEEICAALAVGSFKRAQLRLVESLLARFSYEVDSKAHEVEFKLSQRIAAWEKLRARLKGEVDAEELGAQGFIGRKFPPPIFRRGMHDVFTPAAGADKIYSARKAEPIGGAWTGADRIRAERGMDNGGSIDAQNVRGGAVSAYVD